MSDSGNVSLSRGDLVEAYDDQGKPRGRYRVSRVVNPRVVKVVDEDGIVKSFPFDRLKLVEKNR